MMMNMKCKRKKVYLCGIESFHLLVSALRLAFLIWLASFCHQNFFFTGISRPNAENDNRNNNIRPRFSNKKKVIIHDHFIQSGGSVETIQMQNNTQIYTKTAIYKVEFKGETLGQHSFHIHSIIIYFLLDIFIIIF